MNRFSGKTLFTLGLSLQLKEKGYRVGYCKPVGKNPVVDKGVIVDANALFFKDVLNLDEPALTLSPFVSSFDTLNRALSGKIKGTGDRILKAIKSIKGKDIVLIAGTTDIFEGSLFGINGIRIVRETAAKALIVESWENEETIDALIGAKEMFGEGLAGIVINKVREEAMEFITKKVRPHLKRHRIEVFGILPLDPILGAVTVRTLVDTLAGKVLCAEDRLDQLVENFSIGAMDVNNALRYFKTTPNKAVITGAHRSDIQIAALETSTKCIILTGGHLSNDVIIGKARVKGVPVISVQEDTFTTVNRIESIMGKLKIREKEKLRRAKELVKKRVDIQRLLKCIDVKKR